MTPQQRTDSLAASRDRAAAAFESEQAEEGYEILRAALADGLDLEALNDLAVLAHATGRPQQSAAILDAVLSIDAERADAKENRAALRELESQGAATWRRSRTLGGDDPGMYERAFPGMPRPDVMTEHTARYALAIGHVGGQDVLDLGCGTGYGSEMLSWGAASVRGFDLWQPRDDERPSWPGPRALNYGHDLCTDALPTADAAVMFEVIEHLPDAPAALRIAWSSVGTILASFPNPVHHGSWMNKYHVNDWTLEQFEAELRHAAGHRWAGVDLEHYHQPVGSALLQPGRDPEASFWIVVARGVDRPAPPPASLSSSAEAGSSGRVLPARVTQDCALPARADVEVTQDSMLTYWHRRVEQHLTDTYAGVRLLKFPEDLRVYEHLLWLSRASAVIEIGARFGGSAIWFRDRLRTLKEHGRITADPLVVTMDVDLTHAAPALAGEDGIVLLEGNVTDPTLPDRVATLLPDDARCLVVEDSAHVYETTYAALQGFSRFVPPDGWFVVEDGCVDIEPLRRRADDPRGVLPAIEDWLRTDAANDFERRPDAELYGVTCHPGGWLHRRR